MNSCLCFLIYLARSGSTLLASELDRYESIGVTLEENVPDGIKKGKQIKIKDSKALTNYLEEIYNDTKFQAWGINKTELKNTILKSCLFPLRYRDILHAIHSLYFAEYKPDMIIHKQGNYCFFIEKVRMEFPMGKFLFIDRDPRAIHNSQKKNINSISEKSMNHGIIQFALIYKRMQQIIRYYRYDKFVYVLNYENLVNRNNEELQSILNFLEIKPTIKEEKKSYYSRIPEQQKPLHQNIRSNYNSSRTAGWRNELEPHRIAFLQTVLRKELLDKGFKLYSFPIHKFSMVQKMMFIYWLVRYLILYNLLRITHWNYFSFRKGAFRKFGYG